MPRKGLRLSLHGLHICTIVVLLLLPRKVRIMKLMSIRQGHLLQLLHRRYQRFQLLLSQLLNPVMQQTSYMVAMVKEYSKKYLQMPSRETLTNILIQRPISMSKHTWKAELKGENQGCHSTRWRPTAFRSLRSTHFRKLISLHLVTARQGTYAFPSTVSEYYG